MRIISVMVTVTKAETVGVKMNKNLEVFDAAMLSCLKQLDEDGYPTPEALELIRTWPVDAVEGLFAFIRPMWHLQDWGWREVATFKYVWKEEPVHRFYMSTAGWSGNESIIKAMQDNTEVWKACWESTKRGGHYVFEIGTGSLDVSVEVRTGQN
jgi:hypothetical protein